MEYYPGDIVQVVHKETGMEFPECRVTIAEFGDYVIDLMGARWIVETDDIFESVYPQFELKLIRRSSDEDEDAT